MCGHIPKFQHEMNLVAKNRNIIQPIWVNPMTMEYVNYISRVPQTKWETFVYYSYIQVELDVGGVILPTLCARIIVHPMNFHKKQCSSQCYSLKLLLRALLMKIPALFIIILLFKPAQFIMHTGVNFFLFSKFLPMKVR